MCVFLFVCVIIVMLVMRRCLSSIMRHRDQGQLQLVAILTQLLSSLPPEPFVWASSIYLTCCHPPGAARGRDRGTSIGLYSEGETNQKCWGEQQPAAETQYLRQSLGCGVNCLGLSLFMNKLNKFLFALSTQKTVILWNKDIKETQ